MHRQCSIHASARLSHIRPAGKVCTNRNCRDLCLSHAASSTKLPAIDRCTASAPSTPRRDYPIPVTRERYVRIEIARIFAHFMPRAYLPEPWPATIAPPNAHSHPLARMPKSTPVIPFLGTGPVTASRTPSSSGDLPRSQRATLISGCSSTSTDRCK